jgi:hypothetical protein
MGCLLFGGVLGAIGTARFFENQEMEQAEMSGEVSVAALTPRFPSDPAVPLSFRTLTRDDLIRCSNVLKATGFPPAQTEGGKPISVTPTDVYAGELRNTVYTEPQLRQCLSTLDQLTTPTQPRN